MSENNPVYSIQRTYILNHVLKSEKEIITCDQRIDIPTIEPLSNVKPVSIDAPLTLTVIPCIELASEFLSEFNLTFETNEGVTVLPIKIQPGSDNPLENPYLYFRYVLVLPRGATGIKSCKLIHKATGEEVQHNFTFGIMPPPYNYDNALFGYYRVTTLKIYENLTQELRHSRLATNTLFFEKKQLPKGKGKQTILTPDDMLFFYVQFNYPLSSEPTIHKPKITLHNLYSDFVCTLSLNKTANTILIDLFTGTITAYDSVNGEIIQQFMFNNYHKLITLSFENFDDIDTSYLNVLPKGAGVVYG